MKPVRWGVLGTAKIAVEKVIPAIGKSTESRVVAISSRDERKSKRAADLLGIEKAYDSYERMLEDPDIDVIYNPLPNHLHMSWTVRAADAGKHVLCEKPVAVNSAETKVLIDARDRNGVQIAEAFMVRGHPQWRYARDVSKSGEIGHVSALQCFFSYMNLDPRNIRNIAEFAGSGGVYDIGCYPIVIARFILGKEPRRIIGAVEYDPKLGVDRLASAIVDFDPVQLTFTCGTQLVPYQRMHIFGTAGRIEVEIPFNAPSERPCRVFLDDGAQLGDQSAREVCFNIVDQYRVQADAFSCAVRAGKAPEFPLEDSIKTIRVLEGLVESASSKSWVDLDL